MGVPSFFRWLLEKYPRVIKYVKEEFIEYDDNGERILPDPAGKNPNGIEYDNLYLDMNGIIHPCCHPEGRVAPKTEDEMIRNVFKYIEHIFSMVRPRKILYLAIDGVAPRAKMNQQRARRFRAAQERLEMISTRKKLESYYHKKGWNVPETPPPSWDHNVITPGTPFMDKLAQALRYWVSYKLHNDAGWKGIKVILSDANIPGEGEHKIAQFIRRCRNGNGYDPNTKHVLYGLDADLFMLGLATHEPHFTILREEVLFGKNKPCDKCGQKGHFTDKCTNEPKEKDENGNKTLKPFIFADLSVLREYLEYELRIDHLEWWSLERVIDDFVFLCFFVGNDFLPHLPSLEIREGAIDNLLKYYKQFLPKFGGYLTESGGKVNLNRVSVLLKKLGDIEDEVFKNRTESEHSRKRRNDNKAKFARKERIYKQRKKKNPDNNDMADIGIGNYYDKGGYNNRNNNRRRQQDEINKINLDECKLEDEYDENQVEFLEFFDEYDLKIDEHFMEKDFEHQLKAIHRASQDISKCKKVAKEEDLLFGTQGFKQRYYFKKMKINYDMNPPLLNKLVFEYVRGLCWVMLYYYQGCVSWSWYYPFHYAPFASDLVNIQQFEDKFQFDKIRSKPFSPFGQLMGVLPASSGKVALPKEFSQLMYKSTSPIIDFYPTDFKLDLNGKMYNWQAVILLPFVDADRLCKTIQPLEKGLKGDLKRMNGIGKTLIYVNKSHPLSRAIMPLYKDFESKMEDDDDDDNDEEKDQCIIHKIAMDQQLSQGINGDIETNKYCILPGQALKPPKTVKTLQAIENGVDVISCCYRLPKYQQHKCELLPGCKLPEPILDAIDFENMEKNPRFGKPRQFRRKDSHFNYNRGWDANIGYAEGKYKAKHNKNAQFELHYQPTRREYNQAHSNYYDIANNNNYNGSASIASTASTGGGVGGSGGMKWVPKNKNNDNNESYDNNNDHQDSYNKNARGRGRGRGRERGRGRDRYYSNNSNTGHSSYSRSYQHNQSRTSGYGAYYQQQAPAHQQWYPQQGHGYTHGHTHGHTQQHQYYQQPQQTGYDNYYGNGGYQHQSQSGQYYQQQQQQQQHHGGYYQQSNNYGDNNYGGYNQQHQSYHRANYNQNNNSRKWG